jgi:hypothetical protein
MANKVRFVGDSSSAGAQFWEGECLREPCLNRGCCLGGAQFRRELLAALDELAYPQEAGEEVRHVRPAHW